jgi:integrase/recombinase XerD
MENLELLSQFKEHLEVLNRSPATVNSYGKPVLHYLQDNKDADIKKITRKDMETYISGYYKKGIKITTISSYISGLKRFFEFLEEINLILINPMELVRNPSLKNKVLRNIFTPEEGQLILSQPNLKKPLGIRDRAIMEVMYSTGIRSNEVKNLTFRDVSRGEKTLRISLGKGARDRVVPIGVHALKALQRYSLARSYLADMNPLNLSNGCKWLFLNRCGQQIGNHVIGDMVRKYVESSGIKKNITPHSFRHTFATQLVKNGANLVAVQEMLGHAKLDSTCRYLHSLGLKIKKIHQETHPREEDEDEDVICQIERIR